jgi:hypothetical protein
MFVTVSRVVSLVFIATGCASIVDGTSQVVAFNSNPNGAHVLVNGTEVGVTPLSTQVKRSSDTVVMFRKDGYADQTMTLQTKLNAWFWGNIICGGVLGSTTDGLSGAVREYAPSSYYATLEPTTSGTASARLASGVSHDHAAAIRDFVLVNFDSLKREVQGGVAGEYARALNRLLFEADKPVLSLTELQTALGACDGPVHCAERLADGN